MSFQAGAEKVIAQAQVFGQGAIHVLSSGGEEHRPVTLRPVIRDALAGVLGDGVDDHLLEPAVAKGTGLWLALASRGAGHSSNDPGKIQDRRPVEDHVPANAQHIQVTKPSMAAHVLYVEYTGTGIEDSIVHVKKGGNRRVGSHEIRFCSCWGSVL